jgi:hypothetical protein
MRSYLRNYKNLNKFQILKKNIHNQSYIVLNNQYNEISKLNKEYKFIIKNLNNKINTLHLENLQLNNKNKQLEKELLEKTRFYNLHCYKLK